MNVTTVVLELGDVTVAVGRGRCRHLHTLVISILFKWFRADGVGTAEVPGGDGLPEAASASTFALEVVVQVVVKVLRRFLETRQ